MKSINKTLQSSLPDLIPVVPTMDIVVFPNMIVPLLVLDERIISGINMALENDTKLVLLIASKKQSEDHHGAIGTKDLYDIGTVASIMRLIKIPEGGIKILVQGLSRAKIENLITDDNILQAQISNVKYEENNDENALIAQIKSIKDIAEKISSSGYSFSPDFYIIISKMQDSDKIADFILSHLNLKVERAQQLLEYINKKDFLEALYKELSKELEVSEMQESIKNRARESMNKSQKEFYLREQLKAIKIELGEDDVEDISNFKGWRQKSDV